jgi:hypothetical protein
MSALGGAAEAWRSSTVRPALLAALSPGIAYRATKVDAAARDTNATCGEQTQLHQRYLSGSQPEGHRFTVYPRNQSQNREVREPLAALSETLSGCRPV